MKFVFRASGRGDKTMLLEDKAFKFPFPGEVKLIRAFKTIGKNDFYAIIECEKESILEELVSEFQGVSDEISVQLIADYTPA